MAQVILGVLCISFAMFVGWGMRLFVRACCVLYAILETIQSREQKVRKAGGGCRHQNSKPSKTEVVS
jgi:hypothetical protein